MLSNDIIIHQHISPLPLMQHANLIRNLRQLLEVLLRNGRPIAKQLRRDILPRIRHYTVHLRVLPVRRQPRKQRRQPGLRLRTDSRQPVRQRQRVPVLAPLPGRVLASAVPRDLRLDLGVAGRIVVSVSDVFAEGLLERRAAGVLLLDGVLDFAEDAFLGELAGESGDLLLGAVEELDG